MSSLKCNFSYIEDDEPEVSMMTKSLTTANMLSDEERFNIAMTQIQSLEAELSEFQRSSYELEQELEKELMELENKNLELEEEVITKETQIENWKEKYVNLEKEFNSLSSKNEITIKNYSSQLQSVKDKLVNVEIVNDNIEQKERILNVNLHDLEDKYNQLLEKIALLENELNYKDEMLNKEKLANMNYANQVKLLQEDLLAIKNEAGSLNTHNSIANNGFTKPIFNKVNFTNSFDASDISNASILKSNSMRQIHSIREQAKFIENTVESIKYNIRPIKMRKVSNKETYPIIFNRSNTNLLEDVEIDDAELAENLSMSSKQQPFVIPRIIGYNMNEGNTTEDFYSSKFFQKPTMKPGIHNMSRNVSNSSSVFTTSSAVNTSVGSIKSGTHKSTLQKPPIKPLKDEIEHHFNTSVTNSNSSIGMVDKKTTPIKPITTKVSPMASPNKSISTIADNFNGNGPDTSGLGQKKKKKSGLIPSLRNFNIGL